MNERVFTLQPEYAHYFWQIVLGILLIPFFGAGLYLLFTVYKKRKHTRYRISNHTITTITADITSTVDLVNVQSVEVRRSATDNWFSIGTLLIKTETKMVVMKGVKNPALTADMILAAANTLRAERDAAKVTKAETPPPRPGVMDRMDYLTGLWQQGLISNEDFNREKKHFGE